MGVPEKFDGFHGIFDRCPGDICWVSLIYLMGFPDISHVFP